MSAVETGQMSAAETGQMSLARTDICLVSTHNVPRDRTQGQPANLLWQTHMWPWPAPFGIQTLGNTQAPMSRLGW